MEVHWLISEIYQRVRNQSESCVLGGGEGSPFRYFSLVLLVFLYLGK